MSMIIENFDERFSRYVSAWVRKNASRFRNTDEMEAAMPDVYTRWLNTPAKWLDGESPGLFFAKYDDPLFLIAWMRAYIDASVPLPDPLLERLGELGARAREALLEQLDSDNAEMTMLALTLLEEIEGEPPIARYLDLVLRMGGEGEIAIKATEALRTAGFAALPHCLAAMETASLPVRMCLMDMLADFPGEQRILDHALALLREGANPALMAAYMARIGDESALDALYAIAKDPAIDYLTYIETVGAIEALGGDRPEAREFAGDPMYESLRNIE
jgi:hypothetical protein